YLGRDVLGHHNPFFAPIAAAVCLWATNLVRAQLAVEMMIGVGLGIGVGTAVHAVLGSGPIAMGTAVLISLCAAVLIGRGSMPQRPMFVNQTTMSAILILAFPHTGFGLERLFDASIGGSLAVVFSILLFPKDPLTVLRDARSCVLIALRDILGQIRCVASDSALDWAVAAGDQLHTQLARLVEARKTAIQLAQVCPRRWSLRRAVRTADDHAAQLALFAGSALQLARTVTSGSNTSHPLAGPLRAAVTDLAAAGAALAASDPLAAAAHAASARHHIATLDSATRTAPDMRVAAVIDSCAEQLLRVIDH
ncbi:MAG: FUSC family protein, partial [Mycobacterium sp.]|nr:FUSC family protein [Mycobacterium sp.]